MSKRKRSPRAPSKLRRPTGVSGSPVWTFLTNHAHVLLLLARDPGQTMREIATAVGITERAVQRIVLDLEQAGYLVRERQGRRNRYEVRSSLPLRHPVEAHRSIAALIAVFES